MMLKIRIIFNFADYFEKISNERTRHYDKAAKSSNYGRGI